VRDRRIEHGVAGGVVGAAPVGAIVRHDEIRVAGAAEREACAVQEAVETLSRRQLRERFVHGFLRLGLGQLECGGEDVGGIEDGFQWDSQETHLLSLVWSTEIFKTHDSALNGSSLE
jgi:hypothetical protein